MAEGNTPLVTPRRIVLGAVAVLAAVLAAAPASAAAAVGDLTHRGCITGLVGAGPSGSDACAALTSATADAGGSGLQTPSSVTTSPDGRSLYATTGDNTVTHFSRNPSTGALAFEDCVTGDSDLGPEPVGSGLCDAIPTATSGGVDSGLELPAHSAISPDGASLYVAVFDDDVVARFNRDASTGELTYQSCISGNSGLGPSGDDVCATPSPTLDGDGSGLHLPRWVDVSPDGKSVYAAAPGDAAITRFNRTAGGGLTYQDCFTGDQDIGPAGTDACDADPTATSGGAGSGLDSIAQVEVSADAASVYTASSGDDAVARFDRDTNSGALTYQGCVTGDSDIGPGGTDVCDEIGTAAPGGVRSGLDGIGMLATTVDGASLYTAAQIDSAVARFDRDPNSGALTYQNCITGDTETGSAGSGACAEIPSATNLGDDSGLSGTDRITTSPDSRSVYVGGFGDAAVATFRRSLNPGALTYAGCITGQTEAGPTPAGSGACTPIDTITAGGSLSGLSLAGPSSLDVSADGRSLYASVLFDSAVARFDREVPAPPSGPPSPPTGPAPDTTAPNLTVKGKKTQKSSKVVKLKVTSDEVASVEATGTVKVPVVKAGASAAKAKKSKLKGDTAEIEPGAEVTLKLKLRKGSRKKVKKAHAAGKKAKAKATVSAVDAAGNSSSADRKVKLKRKRR